ncbi:MAG: TIGR00730 family Rossman fold protein [Alphaproteobacteria bacterium]
MMSKQIKSICVYCGSRSGNNPAFAKAAIALAQLCADKGWDLVFGGGSVGLMGIAARAALEHGVRVTGIIPDFLDKLEVAQQGLDEIHFTKTMHERKQKMEQLSDAFVILPGGFGTLDETFEILTWKQLGLHQKPIALLNIEHYWDMLAHLMEHMIHQGFAETHHLHNLRVVESVDEIYASFQEQLLDVTGQEKK